MSKDSSGPSSSVAPATRDNVDRMLEVWKRELPDLDLATEGIVERIQELQKYLDRAMNQTLAEFGLDRGEWHLLGALRRSGPPYRRSPGHLADDIGLSSGAMTNRLDRLEEAGLVRRTPDPDDRRGLKVELTDAGWQAWQDSTGAQAEKEALNGLLRRLMLEFERVSGKLSHAEAKGEPAESVAKTDAAKVPAAT